MKTEDLVKTASEAVLFTIISTLGYMRWRMNHDAADGRIPDGKDIDESLESLYNLQHLTVSQLTRFGISPFNKDGKTPSEEYWKWYETWDDYVTNMPEEDRINLQRRVNDPNEDTSDINPIPARRHIKKTGARTVKNRFADLDTVMETDI